MNRRLSRAFRYTGGCTKQFACSINVLWERNVESPLSPSLQIMFIQSIMFVFVCTVHTRRTVTCICKSESTYTYTMIINNRKNKFKQQLGKIHNFPTFQISQKKILRCFQNNNVSCIFTFISSL